MKEAEIASKLLSRLLMLFISMLFCLACMKKIQLQWKNSILITDGTRAPPNSEIQANTKWIAKVTNISKYE